MVTNEWFLSILVFDGIGKAVYSIILINRNDLLI